MSPSKQFILSAFLSFALGPSLGLALPHQSSPRSSSALAVGATWDYPLGFTLTTSNVNSSTHFYSVDSENTPAETISTLVSEGHFIACYFSAGSIESYRNDTKSIPASAIGNVMDGWPDEKWLDTRNSEVRSVMSTRIQTAQSKGCQGIDADNIDGYDNDTGFDLNVDDAVDYVTFLSKATKAAGMLYGLKNGPELVDSVVDVADWEINESCVEYDECDSFAPFVKQSKPVFHVEYTKDPKATKSSVNPTLVKNACAAGGQKGFSSIVKHESLDNWVIACN